MSLPLPRRVALLLLAVYVGLLALAVLTPTSTTQSGMVLWFSRTLMDVGLPRPWVAFQRLEVVSNVLIVAPAGFLAAATWPARRWWEWTGFGFAGSVLVELTQGLLLPQRDASSSDVVANTAGAMVGALAYLACSRAVAAHRRSAVSSRS